MASKYPCHLECCITFSASNLWYPTGSQSHPRLHLESVRRPQILGSSDAIAQMMSSKLPFISAVILAFMISISAALSIPSSLSIVDTLNNTYAPALAPPQHVSNLTFTPWPPLPYKIDLSSTPNSPCVTFTKANPYKGTHSVRLYVLISLLQEFGLNLNREYPIPGEVPRHAKQFTIDLESHTKWTVSITEAPFGYRLPTDWALRGLNIMAKQLRSHDAADLVVYIEVGVKLYSEVLFTNEPLSGSF